MNLCSVSVPPHSAARLTTRRANMADSNDWFQKSVNALSLNGKALRGSA